MSKIIDKLRDTYTENPAAALNVIPEICKAIDEGYIKQFPCKVGDKIFALKGCFYLPHAVNIPCTAIIECEVRGIKITAKGIAILLLPLVEEAYGRRSAYKWFSVSSIGYTVFLTRPEAERRLESEKK